MVKKRPDPLSSVTILIREINCGYVFLNAELVSQIHTVVPGKLGAKTPSSVDNSVF